jgi:hypothetical protein
MRRASAALKKSGTSSPKLDNLATIIEGFNSAAGPAGWLDWLLEMRNMLVHRGRRLLAWNITRGRGGIVEEFVLQLPRSPGLTDVEAIVNSGGYIAAQFEMPHDEFLKLILQTVNDYVANVAGSLLDLWTERKAHPSILEQPSQQWKNPQGVILPPSFGGYADSKSSHPVTNIGTSTEIEARLRAAGLTHHQADDLGPEPSVWL